MRKLYNVAVVGATGIVGIEIIKILEKRNFPINNLKLIASSHSIGKTINYKGQKHTIEDLNYLSFRGVDIAFFSAGTLISKKFVPYAIAAQAIVIDNSNAFRNNLEIPLVIPEINFKDIKNHKGIIASPNCSTTIMLLPVYPLHKEKKLKRLIVSTYQATSGAGIEAILEMEEQTKNVLEGRKVNCKIFPHQIAFNIFPHIDIFMDNAYTKEEIKMLDESRKIMNYPELQVNCTSVRIPVYRSHSESILMEFEENISPEEAKEILLRAPGVKIVDNLIKNLYPMPINASGKDEIFVGRIRQDISRNDKRGLSMFISGDQILKGAALNVVQISEYLLDN